jgi:hypothetical protein
MSSTDLVVTQTLTANIVFVPGGVDSILDKIKNEVRSFQPDISTKSGREAIASMAYKVARSKTALDEMGKELVADWKAKASAVDEERRKIRSELDALKDEVRKPLTDWESAERSRVAAHEDALRKIEEVSRFAVGSPTSSDVTVRINQLEEIMNRDWQEFADRAAAASKRAKTVLDNLLTEATQREAEQAELERLRREKAEREQKEREDRIAAEAAARAKAEAEEKAAAEAREREAQAQAERERARQEQERVEREKAEALEQARKAEADRLAAEEKAAAERVAAEQRAEAEKKRAVEAERQRIADEKAHTDRERERREADKKHRAQFNNEALAALVSLGLDEAVAKTAIAAIARGDVPHITINY